MNDREKTKSQLASELAEMRRRVAELEASEEERKVAEEALQTSEERFRVLVEECPVGIYYSDFAGTFLYGNKEAERIIGYNREELIGKNYLKLKLLGPKDIGKAIKLLALNKLGKGTGPDEFTLNRKDGSKSIVEIYTRVVNYDGKKLVLGMVTDVTDREQAEEALRQSEERYRTILRIALDGFTIDDLDGRLLEVNDSYCKMVGYTRKELLAMFISDLEAKENPEETAQHAKAIMERGHDRFETRHKCKDGRIIDLEVSANYVDVGEGQVFVSVRDITERKQAEEALRQSEEKLRLMFWALPVGITVIDADSKIIQANEVTARIYGYDNEEEIVGLNIYDFIAKKDHARVRKIGKRTLKEGPLGVIELTQLRKDRSEFPAEVSGTVLRDASGNSAGFITVTEDITERRKAEEREKQLQQELIVSSRLASVGEMAAGIAHEINNPLTGVIGFAGLLLKKNIPEDIRSDLNAIYEGARRIASVTSRMLTFARQQRPERTSVNINDIIETTLAIRDYDMKNSNIKVQARLAPDLPATIVDAGQIQQVFLNIILNAEIEMKRVHHGGKLTVETERINNTIRISFKDDGPGISKKNLEKIFEPFFTTREIGEGSGLGLSISHGIVTQHGGKIYARSRPGKGATFIVELPIVTRAEQLKLGETVAEAKKVVGAKILVVDDEPAVQDLLSEVLGGEGYEVEIVGSGKDALKKFTAGDYDVILLDVKLPGMSGIQLYERIQKTASPLVGRVIFITGDVMNVDTMAFILSSGAPYITKPFSGEEILEGIGRILGQK